MRLQDGTEIALKPTNLQAHAPEPSMLERIARHLRPAASAGGHLTLVSLAKSPVVALVADVADTSKSAAKRHSVTAVTKAMGTVTSKAVGFPLCSPKLSARARAAIAVRHVRIEFACPLLRAQ